MHGCVCVCERERERERERKRKKEREREFNGVDVCFWLLCYHCELKQQREMSVSNY